MTESEYLQSQGKGQARTSRPSGPGWLSRQISSIARDRKAFKEWQAFDRAVSEWLQAQGLEGERGIWGSFPTSKEGKGELVRQITEMQRTHASLEEMRRRTMRAQARLLEKRDKLAESKAIDRTNNLRKQLIFRTVPSLLFFSAAVAARTTWPEISNLHLVLWPLLGFVFAHIIVGFSGLFVAAAGLYITINLGGSWWWLALVPLGIGLGVAPEKYAWFREMPDFSLGVKDVYNAFEDQ